MAGSAAERTKSMEKLFSDFQYHLQRWSSEPLDPLPPGMPQSDVYDSALNSLQEISNNFSRVMDQATRKLRTYRNSVVPINSLCVEVLCLIFVAVGDDIRDKLHIAETCNLWRAIALSYPLMWTSLDFCTVSNLSAISAILRRGEDHPLRIKCHYWNDSRLQCVLSELPRVQELNVWTSAIPHTLISNAPALKRLTVTNPTGRADHEISLQSRNPSSPPSILEQLTLIDCRMSFTSMNLSGLRELSIHSSEEMTSYFPPVLIRGDRNIISLLGDCPNLERLSLQGGSLGQSGPPVTIPVKLSRLQSMRLSLSPSDTSCVLSGIATPALRRCILETRGLRTDENHVPFLTETFRDLLALTEILVVDEHTTLLCAYNTQTNSTFVCSVNPFFHPEIYRTMVNRLEYYPMPRVHTVRLRRPIISDIIMLLRSFHSVQTLELVYMPHHSSPLGNNNVVHQLLIQAKDKDHPLVCTNLHTLSLERVYLSMHAVDELSELAVLWPNLRQLNFTWCKGDLPMDEIAEHLGLVSVSVECSYQPIGLYDGVDVDMEAFYPLTM